MLVFGVQIMILHRFSVDHLFEMQTSHRSWVISAGLQSSLVIPDDPNSLQYGSGQTIATLMKYCNLARWMFP